MISWIGAEEMQSEPRTPRGDVTGGAEARKFQNQDAMALAGHERGADRSRLFWSAAAVCT